MQSNYFRPAASFLLGDWRGREDATVHDALPEGHGPEHPHPDPRAADLLRSHQPGKENHQDHSTEENGWSRFIVSSSSLFLQECFSKREFQFGRIGPFVNISGGGDFSFAESK